MPNAAPASPLRRLATLLALASLAVPAPGSAGDAPASPAPSLAAGEAAAPAAADRLLPLGGAWARARGIDLPLPLGVGLFAVSMRRDVEVTDVRVTLPGAEPASVSDVASFAVANQTTMAAVKVDAWLLPVLDVYLLGGYAWTDSRLDATVTIERPLHPAEPLVLRTTQDAQVGGPLLGAGATLVAGAGPWFVLADANYSHSAIEGFDGGLGALFLSTRTGWSGTTGWGGWRGWVGAAFIRTGLTLTMHQETAAGTVVVEVDQRPVNPWTAQLGGSASLGKRWDALLEVGSNFEDAFLLVGSAAYRF